MNDIKPIETIYNGYRFRSRLEARWAVFFDSCGVEYEYEPEGYELGDGLRYLPDFLIHGNHGRGDYDLYVEVKGGKISDIDNEKIRRFCELTKSGNPKRSVLLVGNIPNGNDIYKLLEFMESESYQDATLDYLLNKTDICEILHISHDNYPFFVLFPLSYEEYIDDITPEVVYDIYEHSDLKIKEDLLINFFNKLISINSKDFLKTLFYDLMTKDSKDYILNIFEKLSSKQRLMVFTYFNNLSPIYKEDFIKIYFNKLSNKMIVIDNLPYRCVKLNNYNFQTIDGDYFPAYPVIQDNSFCLIGDNGDEIENINKEKTLLAYRNARQARFEHGENKKYESVI